MSEESAIAVVGLAGRFPGASNVDELWRLLLEGREALSSLTDEELREAGVPEAQIRHPRYVRALMRLADADQFDAAFFGYTPGQAASIDPQQRIFLECAWEALESAGFCADSFEGSIGTFAGSGTCTYLLANPHRLRTSADPFTLILDSEKDFAATRTAYKLGLTGPALGVQTACSSSLVAVHLAAQSLLAFECDLALAGGVGIDCTGSGYLPVTGGIRSLDGHCRAYDANATGLVGGSGAGIVVLRRLGDALRDGDQIHAVLCSTVVNNDGGRRAGFTAPGLHGQVQLLATGLSLARLAPRDIGLIEGHGTGTSVGDAIELSALTQVYGSRTGQSRGCALGSLKTNIGHLDAAAGVAGLIKAILCVRHATLVPSLNFQTPNAILAACNSPFYVNTQTRPWPGNVPRRRAAVSSFGIGGTNAHVILEQAPEVAAGTADEREQLFVLSARSGTALTASARNLREHLLARAHESLADVAYTLQVGRTRHHHRRFVIAKDRNDLIQQLAADSPEKVECGASHRPIVFLFPGQGTRFIGAAEGLYRHCERFRFHYERCAQLLLSHDAEDIRELWQRPPRSASILQPALIAFEYSLAQFWMECGVRPGALIGHSLGEYAAACIAGSLSIEDALALVQRRAQIIERLPAGRMLAVGLGPAQISEWLLPGVELACVNSPAQCVLSGQPEMIEALEPHLRAREVSFQNLPVARAFHSALMEEGMQPLEQAAAQYALRAPDIPFVQGVTGQLASSETPPSPSYWAKHLRQPVQFAAGIETLARRSDLLFLELGPNADLLRLTRSQLPGREDVAFVGPRFTETSHTPRVLLQAIGQLWSHGASITWKTLHAGQRRRRVALPTYPFERQRHWIERENSRANAAPCVPPEQASRPLALEHAFHVPSWVATLAPPPPQAGALRTSTWIIFAGTHPLSQELLERLQAHACEVVVVSFGDCYAEREARFSIRADVPADYRRLFARLETRGTSIERVLHCWGLDANDFAGRAERAGSASGVLALAQALLAHCAGKPATLTIVSATERELSRDSRSACGAPAVCALCKVLSQEHPSLQCATIEVPAETPRQSCSLYADWILGEGVSGRTERAIRYRARERFVQRYAPLALPEHATPLRRLRREGVYLLTGGLGGIGITLAEYLVARYAARLVLVRKPCADAAGERPGETRRRASLAARVRALEAAGAQILVQEADVCSLPQMRRLVSESLRRFERIDGLFHLAVASRHRSLCRPFVQLEASDLEAQWMPKVSGLDVLARAFEGHRPDFCIAPLPRATSKRSSAKLT